MQYINCARTCAEGNLSLFQSDNSLYCRSNREIKINEELLVYFGDEHMGCLDQNVETYLSVTTETELEDVYGCTFCCLGFISEVHLAKHKAACTKGTRIYIGSADLVRCTFCKIYLEEKEHLEHHVDYCCERYARKYLSSPSPANRGENKIESDVKHQLQKIYNVIQKKHKCPECPYQTNDRHDLKKHQYRHANIKPFECTTCKRRFTQKGHLTMHIKNKHEAVTDKEYKCRFCPYQTNGKGDFKLHLYVHDTVKRFECEICGKRFRQKANLQVHLKNLHLAVNSKKFACSKCAFRTNYKHSLDKHVNHTHNGPAPVTCHLCNGQFKQIYTLKQHIKYKHATMEEEKEFKCPVCPYEAQRKWCLKRHLATHDEEKQYNCHRCDYSTICEINLTRHMTKHPERKPYPCEICGKVFTRKGAFKVHIRHTHPIIVE
ncbi:zinc finger protein [Oryctes borbonicus]|uniref:Zinc finger protein n=1 Tax=Oryctes borbonicus TaxID=1629725 RepID=A0A0T6BG88_9SCAR|nr:zinc finger protein [Oryctes borbonicus]